MLDKSAVKITPVEFLDANQKNLVLEFYNKNFPLSRWSEKYFNSFLQDTSRIPLGFFIKEKDFYIGLILGRINDDGLFNINTLLVKPAYQGKGLGCKLIQEILFEIANNNSIEKAYLHFRDQNKLENFYKKLGFKNHCVKGCYTNGDKKHYMDIILVTFGYWINLAFLMKI